MQNLLFILYGNSSFSNRGCEAILRSTVSILTEEFGPCHFIDSPPCWFPSNEFTNIGPNVEHIIPPKRQRWSKEWLWYQIGKRILRRPKEAFVPYLSEAAAALAIGGDNYTLDYGIPWQRIMHDKIILSHRKPVIFWGASVGPFDKQPMFEKSMIRHLKNIALICARESESVAYLQNLGISKNVKLVADPAFTLRPEQIAESDGVFNFIKRPCIGINLSPLISRYFGSEASWFDCAVNNIRMILKEIDLPILFVPHVFAKGRSDYVFMKKVMDRLDESEERISIFGPEYNCRQIKWVISRLTAFVGARTHSTIAAMSSCVPTISIGYSIKSKGINKDVFGHLDWHLECNTLSKKNIQEALKRLLDNHSGVKQKLESVMPGYKQRAKDAAKYMREVIDTNQSS